MSLSTEHHYTQKKKGYYRFALRFLGLNNVWKDLPFFLLTLSNHFFLKSFKIKINIIQTKVNQSKSKY